MTDIKPLNYKGRCELSMGFFPKMVPKGHNFCKVRIGLFKMLKMISYFCSHVDCNYIIISCMLFTIILNIWIMEIGMVKIFSSSLFINKMLFLILKQKYKINHLIVLPTFLTFFSPLSDKAVEVTALEGVEMKNFTTEFPEDKIELAEDNPHNLEFNQRVFGYSPERSTDVDVPSKIKA